MNPCYPFYVAEDTDHKDSPPPYESCEPAMEMRDSAPSLFELRDVQPTDAFIAVMGMTGSGKSTFIQHFCDTAIVGDGLKSGKLTAVVEAHQAPDEIDGRRVIFIDTPGFDDTNRPDSAILREIANWLNKAHESEIKLTGIVYLHAINTTRVTGTVRNNLRMFKKLCGEDSMSSVALATTHWGSGAADRERQDARHKELLEDKAFWKPMILHGATPFIHDGERRTALEIVRHLLENRPQDGIDLTIQKEMADGITLDKTAAGIVLEGKLETRKEFCESEINDLQKEIAEVRQDNRLTHQKREIEVRSLEEDVEKWKKKIKSLEKDCELLKVNRDQLQLERSRELEEEARRHDEMEVKLQAERDQNEHLRHDNARTKKQLKQIKARIRQAQGCALM
ncbi:hypothetical protein Z517_07797 [Fonsecaea pedrosoi CBS 271.37]|uniref:G domain-containing protein n=1 Tax=Fonsecaea pedrosoi CBS 271.37 TaxID=1442368 RepID=A0A0D2GZX3_9EURO|nr:uncharacterized protein Z517_07797 [Fonsecaea pedrosoi CBS 271.37]KIW77964.1 hypothetical protein Z517_07797 [Fonsecaea pedrosoi CBS 271.37]